MKTFFIIRALFIAIASFFLSLYIENTTITALTLGIVCLGFIANLNFTELLLLKTMKIVKQILITVHTVYNKISYTNYY